MSASSFGYCSSVGDFFQLARHVRAETFPDVRVLLRLASGVLLG